MYVHCIVCYCVIATPYVRSVVMSLMMMRNAQWTMSCLYSLMFSYDVMCIIVISSQWPHNKVSFQDLS